MPFDSTQRPGLLAVHMIDLMLERFDEGKFWVCGVWNDGHGGHCLVSMMASIRATDGIGGDGTAHYIRRAIANKKNSAVSLQWFNDVHSWDRIKHVLLRARELADADANAG